MDSELELVPPQLSLPIALPLSSVLWTPYLYIRNRRLGLLLSGRLLRPELPPEPDL